VGFVDANVVETVGFPVGTLVSGKTFDVGISVVGTGVGGIEDFNGVPVEPRELGFKDGNKVALVVGKLVGSDVGATEDFDSAPVGPRELGLAVGDVDVGSIV